jgi:hypothetical protein
VSKESRRHYWQCREELEELANRMGSLKQDLFIAKVDPTRIVPYEQLFPEDEYHDHFLFVDEFVRPIGFEDDDADSVLKRRYRGSFDYE